MADESTVDYKSLSERQAEEIRQLNARVEKAEGESARRKEAVNDLKAKLAQAEEQTSDRLKADNAKLRGEIRAIKHRDGFKALFEDEELGLNPAVSVDRLMKLLDYTPADEAFDADGVKGRIAAMKETDPYLFGRPASGTEAVEQSARSRQPIAPAWAGRGKAAAAPTVPEELTPAQMRDPGFMAKWHQAEAAKSP